MYFTLYLLDLVSYLLLSIIFVLLIPVILIFVCLLVTYLDYESDNFCLTTQSVCWCSCTFLKLVHYVHFLCSLFACYSLPFFLSLLYLHPVQSHFSIASLFSPCSIYLYNSGRKMWTSFLLFAHSNPSPPSEGTPGWNMTWYEWN